MSIKINGSAFTAESSGAGYFEALFKKFDEKHSALRAAIDAYFAEVKEKEEELKETAKICESAKDAALRSKEYACDSAKNCLSGANTAAAFALECERYVVSAKMCADNIDGIYEIIKKIERNVEELEKNALAFANEAEAYEKRCVCLSDDALESAHKSEHYALKSELAFESARIAHQKCEDILSDIKFYEKTVSDAQAYIENAVTIKSVSANGKKISPDENKNVDIAVFDDIIKHSAVSPDSSVLNSITTSGVYRLRGGIEGILLVSKYQSSVYQVIFKTLSETVIRRIFYKSASGNFFWSRWEPLLNDFDGKVSVTNKNFLESIPWKIADGVHKLVMDLAKGIILGRSVYEGILISASHTEYTVGFIDKTTAVEYEKKYITQTLIYTESGAKTRIKTRNACIITRKKTGELYEETYGDWEDAFDIDGNTIVSESYLKGNGAPTETTVADFVGQMYLDNTNTKLYQCTSITTSETDGTKSYEWIKVIRGNDYASIFSSSDTQSKCGIVCAGGSKYGITIGLLNSDDKKYPSLTISSAQPEDIHERTSQYKPITPFVLDYAVRSVRPVTADTMPTTLATNTIYSINNTSSTSVALTLPQGQSGDFIQYDFVTGTTAPTVTIQSTYGMTEFDFTPEANKIYSLFFDWGIIAVENNANVYGWRISYTEYDYTPSTEE